MIDLFFILISHLYKRKISKNLPFFCKILVDFKPWNNRFLADDVTQKSSDPDPDPDTPSTAWHLPHTTLFVTLHT